MGKSLYLFPDPVKELAPVCRELEIPILYDGAHVLGLIAGGQFHDPLAEGATWLTGSTHKTFPGPQRGVILGNLDAEGEKKYWGAADRGVFPGTSSNHHLYSLPALLVAVREMKAHGKAYAAQICKNAVALAKSLEACGIPVEAKEFGYTRSHQIAVNVSAFGGGVKAALALEANDIICNYNMLPGDSDADEPLGPAHRHPGNDPLRHEGKGFRRPGRADGRGHQGQEGQGQGQPAARPLPGNAVRVRAVCGYYVGEGLKPSLTYKSIAIRLVDREGLRRSPTKCCCNID